jgi:FAD:protein FMN transferase
LTKGATAGEPAAISRFETRAMGSPLRLTIGAGATRADASARWWRTVVEEFEAAEAAMSRFRDASELTVLNRSAGSGVIVRPSARLRRALVAADRATRITNGRFDPRVIGDLDRLGYRGAAIGDEVTAARRAAAVVERVGRDGVTLARAVDLGGIGKGLTLRWAAARLAAGGAGEFLLEAGGDLVARGACPDGGHWQLGIEDPDDRPDPLAVIAVTDMAVTTSSTRVHRWTVDGREVHHLLDPRTGEPATGGLVSVTVAAPDPAWAEVWSKVLFLEGRDAIPGEARSRGLAVWWVADDGTLEMTAAARALTIWVAGETTSEAGVKRAS